MNTFSCFSVLTGSTPQVAADIWTHRRSTVTSSINRISFYLSVPGSHNSVTENIKSKQIKWNLDL